MKLINDVVVKRLKKISTKDLDGKYNGWLIDVLRNDDKIKSDGNNFSQLYVTTCLPKMIKGFHLHQKKTDHFCAIGGKIKMVLIDDRQNSSTFGMKNEFIMGDENPIIIRVPPGVKHGFKNVGETMIYLINYMTPSFDKNDPDTKSSKEDVKW
jgi:dTDP-4-dehydrorhamnose 3,5-epimerase